MAASIPPPFDDALLQRLDEFEAHWQRGSRPALDHFLPDESHRLAEPFTFELLATDLDWRARAGDAPPLSLTYFNNCRLRIAPARQFELLRLEYQFRWMRGDANLKRSEYQAWFPDLAGELATLTPKWDCPRCKLEGISLGDEAARECVCPRCENIYRREHSVGAARPTAFPQIPGFVIDSVLGEGGLGIVYRARTSLLGSEPRQVALKMMRQDRILAATLVRMEREAEIWHGLNHPGIARLFGRGEHRGLPFLAIELVSGLSLDKRLQGRPQSAAAAARIVRLIAEAMEYAHAQGIIHRDLKPGNILMQGAADQPLADCVPRVTDFGLAKRIDEAGGETRTSAVFGTAAYMAPEQARSAKLANAQTDIYALGAILYETLTGRPPFQGAGFEEILHQVLFTDPLPPRQLVPSVPRDLETICLKCLEKVPAARYASADQLGQDLQRFLDGKLIQARPPSLWRRGKRWTERNRSTATGLAVSVLIVFLAVGGGFLYQESQLLEAERKAHVAADDKAAAEENARRVAEAARAAAELDAAKRRALAETIVQGIPLPDPIGLNGYSFPVSVRYGEKLPFKDIVLRAEQIARKQANASPPAVHATVLDNLGNAFRTLGFYDKAERLLTEALDSRRALADDRDTAESEFHLAGLFHERGDYARADVLYLQALDRLRRLLADDDPAVTEIIFHRAWLYLQDEDFQKATELFEETLHLRRQRHGDDQRDVLRAELGLAAIPAERGRPDESMTLFLPAVVKLTQASGDKDLQQGVAHFFLGISLGKSPLPAQGITPLKKAFDDISRTDSLGPAHLYAALIAVKLGELYEQCRQAKDAEYWYQKGLEIVESKDALGQARMPEFVGKYARFLNRHNRADEAAQLFAPLLAARRAQFGYVDPGPDHFAIATVLREFAKALGDGGNVQRQQQVLQQAVQILEQTGRVRRQFYAPCLLDLAETRFRQGDFAGAAVYLDRADDAEQKWLERREDLQAQILAFRVRLMFAP